MKSGDQLTGVAAENAEERVAAKVVLSELTLADLREHPVVDYDKDEVTRIIGPVDKSPKNSILMV